MTCIRGTFEKQAVKYYLNSPIIPCQPLQHRDGGVVEWEGGEGYV